MEKACNHCKAVKEESTEFQFRPELGAYRGVCKECRNKQLASRRKQKMQSDEEYFWLYRMHWINNKNGRRTKRSRSALNDKLNFVEIKALYDETKNCHYCKVALTKEQVVLDHATPLSRGGINHISNIRICCNDCNQLKGVRDEEEFRKFLDVYITRFTGER